MSLIPSKTSKQYSKLFKRGFTKREETGTWILLKEKKKEVEKMRNLENQQEKTGSRKCKGDKNGNSNSTIG